MAELFKKAFPALDVIYTDVNQNDQHENLCHGAILSPILLLGCILPDLHIGHDREGDSQGNGPKAFDQWLSHRPVGLLISRPARPPK